MGLCRYRTWATWATTSCLIHFLPCKRFELFAWRTVFPFSITWTTCFFHFKNLNHNCCRVLQSDFWASAVVFLHSTEIWSSYRYCPIFHCSSTHWPSLTALKYFDSKNTGLMQQAQGFAKVKLRLKFKAPVAVKLRPRRIRRWQKCLSVGFSLKDIKLFLALMTYCCQMSGCYFALRQGSRSLSLSLTKAHVHTHTLFLSLSLTHTRSPYFSLTHTRSPYFSLTHTETHTWVKTNK